MTVLADFGPALFGEHWRAPMARALRVSERTVQRWEKGQNPTPAWVGEELTKQLRAHHARIAALLDERKPT